ncbi:hypothetical protein JTB14_006537 [Gonioctena quinquepunctata]|nr:hypothetical protein JTB14_006537 [Gonioctena quinquepunctata]
MKEIVVAPRNSPPILVRIGTSIPLDGEAGIVQPAITQLDITQPATINQPKKTRICCNKPNACKFWGRSGQT